ncbi:hypothetical protein [Rubripirellula tenax]|nr:hypothetical protein [Rubripirellula tenax]
MTVTANAQDAEVDLPVEARHVRAEPYMGTWGVRILHPTAYDFNSSVNAENFDIDAFMGQIDQLESISHVMININRGHQGSWWSSPYPEMAEKLDPSLFPKRDLFAELADAPRARGLKVLVYFNGSGFDGGYLPKEIMKKWKSHCKQEGMTHYQAVSNVLEYYSLKHGKRIDGWWIDRVGGRTDEQQKDFAEAVRAGYPMGIVTMNKGGSVPTQGTPYNDYTHGHPIPMNKEAPWLGTNVRMVEKIESGPWIGANNVPDDREGTTFGFIFMPLQAKWRDGLAGHPNEQALDWMTRTMEADGFYCWAVAREGNLFAARQFKQLLYFDLHFDPRVPAEEASPGKQTAQ